MSRSVPWRNKPTPLISQMLPLAAEMKLYLVNEIGPTSFLFKDESENKFKVVIGSKLSCSCGVVEGDHCIHTLYVLLKKYRVAETNPIIWQASYLDSELEGLIQYKYTAKKKEPPTHYKPKRKNAPTQEEEQNEDFLPLGEDQACPICYEDLAGQCYSTCGTCRKSIHSKCFKVWIKHKQDHGQPVTCPMCRSEFHNPMVLVLSDLDKWEKRFTVHKGTLCRTCGAKNIKGLIYRCLVCPNTDLCRLCYEGNQHLEHDKYFVKELSTQSWRLAPFRVKKTKQQLFQAIKQFQTKDLPGDIHSFEFICSLFPTLKQYAGNQGASDLGIVGNEMLMRQICYKCRKPGDDSMRRLHCGHSVHAECLRLMHEGQDYVCQVDQQNICPGYCAALGIKVSKGTKKAMVDATFVRAGQNVSKIKEKLEGDSFGFMHKVQRLNQKKQGSFSKINPRSKDKNFRIMKKSVMDRKLELQQLGIGMGFGTPMMVTGLSNNPGNSHHLMLPKPPSHGGPRNRTVPKPM